MPYYVRCETPGCRHVDDLEFCDRCDVLVCEMHSVESAKGQRRCRRCAPKEVPGGGAGVPLKTAQPRPPQQLDLFSSVRPRASKPAHDGLQR